MAQEDDVLSIVKMRLAVSSMDTSKDDLIETYITEIKQRILHYCNITAVPDDLVSVWASMVVDALRVDQATDDTFGGTAGSATGGTIKVGDTSVGSGSGGSGGLSNTAKKAIDQIVFNYRLDLHYYRRMRW